MSVTSLDKDLDGLTMTLVADFSAPVEQVWDLFADPRKLERWWGPPGFPATVRDHDLSPGGTVRYYMTSPEGERMHGYWQVLDTSPPTRFEFTDGFGDETGAPNSELPTTTTTVSLAPVDSGTRLEIVARFDTREQMTQLLEMGMDEGFRQSVNQMDAVLAA